MSLRPHPLLAVVILTACSNSVPGRFGGPGADLDVPTMHRLTRSQYLNSVRDVLGVELPDDTALEPDVHLNGLVAIGAGRTTISPLGVEQYETAAYAAAELALADTAARDRLIPCTASGPVDDACARTVIAAVGGRAWRRPLTEAELDRYVGVAGTTGQALGDFDGGVEFAIAGLLQSPNFLFRVEPGEPDPDERGRRRFTSYEMAARLSYLLWNSTPDDELLAAAGRGELVDTEGLTAQAERLLGSARGRDGVRRFFTDLFALEQVGEVVKDGSIFPDGVGPATLGASARAETLALLEHLVMDQDADFRDLFTTRTAFVNPELAALYDLPAPGGDGMVQVELPADGERAGLLGQASFLALNAHEAQSSPTLRGKAVRQTFLCQAIDAPPPDVDATLPEVSTAPTVRERLDVHRTDPTCSGCHELMDPIGFGLERFDALGAFRTQENGADIDPSGTLDGTPFDDAAGLGAALRGHPELAGCFVRKLFSYATGYPPTNAERAMYGDQIDQFRDAGYRVKALVLAMIAGDGFRGAYVAE